MHVRRGVVDGVPVRSAAAPGLHQAALVFRVGRADETLASSGITHLVEHLAMHAVGHQQFDNNAFVGATITAFTCEGEADEVRDFVATVATRLHDLPLDRLDRERGVLRTESAGRDRGVAGPLAVWRFGAQTYGLLGYDELGLGRLAAGDVMAWAARYFCRENAVLWVTGDPIPDLSIPLPSGRGIQPPEPSSALPMRPAYITGDFDGAAFSALVPRSTEMVVVAEVLERRLRDHLRTELGLSYHVATSYDVVDRHRAFVGAFADGVAEGRSALSAAFVAQVRRLADEGPTPAEVELARTGQRVPRSDDRSHVSGILHYEAMACLFGDEPWSLDRLMAQRAAVTSDGVQAAARTMESEALFLVPPEPLVTQDLRRHGVVEAASESSQRFEDGRAFWPVDFPATTGLLVVSSEGVTIGGGGVVTVAFASCAVALAWPDGRRVLIGNDGFAVTIEPTLWERGSEITALVDEGVPSAVVVPMDARPADAIPRPVAPWYCRRAGLIRIAVACWAAVIAAAIACGLVYGVEVIAFGIPIGIGWGLTRELRERLQNAELASRS